MIKMITSIMLYCKIAIMNQRKAMKMPVSLLVRVFLVSDLRYYLTTGGVGLEGEGGRRKGSG